MKNNYLLESSDPVSLHRKIEELIEQNGFQGACISSYDVAEVPLSNALQDLDTYSFLSEKKVVIISSLENLKTGENEEELEHLYRYMDHYNSDYLLFVCASKLNSTLKLTKNLKKRMEYIKICVDEEDFVKGECKNYQLESGVVQKLVEYCGHDISKLAQECNKLKTYKIAEKKITKQDVSLLVKQKLGDASELTFAFSRSLACRDKKEALKSYQELLNYQVEPLAVIGLLASQIRIMYQVKVLEKRHVRTEEIANILKQKPYRVTKTKELTKFYSEAELLGLLIELSDIDVRIKTSDVDPNFLIQSFIFKL